MPDRKLLDEQLAYYRARAQEYDESIQQMGRFAAGETPDPAVSVEWDQAIRTLQAVGPVDHILELACGTGLWTKELAKIGRRITALDGSPEMLALNRSKVADARVHYATQDIFAWEPVETYDLVFFAFWLSHVPESALAEFLRRVVRVLCPGGRVFIVDEPADGRQLSGPVQEGQKQTRTLYDGRTFQIVKVYYPPVEIKKRLQDLGVEDAEFKSGEYFFTLTGVRRG